MASAAAAAATVVARHPAATHLETHHQQSEAHGANSDEAVVTLDRSGSHTSRLREYLESDQAEQQQSRKRHWLLDSMAFHVTISLLIVSNTVMMGIEADYPEWVNVWQITENFFTAAFLLEMLLKLWVLGRQYFREGANLLDATLVVFSIIDTWLLQLLGGSVDLQSLTILRVMRIFRLARILRLLKHFERLLIIMCGVIDAIRSTCWVTLILFGIIYACAIFCTDFIGRGEPTLYPGYSLEESGYDSSTIMQDFNPYVCFGSMTRSMFTLFNMVILSEWAEVTRPLMAKQPHFILFFVFFVIFTTFGLMNVVVGMIVDSVMSHVRDVLAEKEESELKRKLSTLSELQRFVGTIDENKDGKLTLPELQKALQLPAMQSLLKDVNLPRDIGPGELLAMLDDNGDGALVGDEFVRGFFRLIEGNSFQHACLNQIAVNSVKSMVRHQMELATQTRDLVHHFNAKLDELREEVRASSGSLRGMVAEEEGVFNTGIPMSSHSKMEPEKECAEVASQPACVMRQAASQAQPCAYSAEGLSIEWSRDRVPILESMADVGLHRRVPLKEEDTFEDEPKEPGPTVAMIPPWAPPYMQEQQTSSPEAQDLQSLTRPHGHQLRIKLSGSSGGVGQPGAERSGEGCKADGEASLRSGHGPRGGSSKQVHVSSL